jgi:predicted Zn-dependent protease
MDIDALEKMLAAGRDSAMLRFTLGAACARQGRQAEAIDHLSEAVRQDPSYSAAWQALGRAREATGDEEGALDSYRRGLEAANGKGDMQVVRALQVFIRRLEKRRGSGASGAADTSPAPRERP